MDFDTNVSDVLYGEQNLGKYQTRGALADDLPSLSYDTNWRVQWARVG